VALAEAAKLIATLDLGGNFVKNLGSADRALGKFDSHIDRSQSKAYQAGQKIGTGIKAGAAIAAVGVGILATEVTRGLQSLVELEQQQAQTNAVLKSTKGAAGISAKAVTDLSEKYESLNAIVGDEVIRSTENMLLTFTNVKKQAFEPALQAILDMNTALGKGPEGLTSTAIQVGKALNDPTKGLTALQRVGVTFDKGQVKRIKQLQKEGKTYEAQKIILAELNKEFGGSFLAQGNTTAGKVAKFNDAIDDLERALAETLLPALGNVADALSTFLRDPQTVNDIRNLGRDIGKLFSPANIRQGIDALKTGFQFLKDAAGAISTVVSTAVKAFTSLPPEVQKLLVGGFVVNKLTGGLVTDLIEGVAKTALNKIGLMTVQAGVVNVAGGVGGVPVPGGGGAAPAGTLASIVSSVLGAPGLVAGIAAIGAKAATDAFNAQAGTQLQFPAGFAGIPQSLDFIATGIRLLTDGPITTNDDGTQAAVEASRGAIVAAINRIPTGGGDRGPGTQGDMESRRGAIGDALSAAEIGKQVEQGVGPDIELVRQAVATGLDDTTAGLETVRGTVSTGLNNTSTSARNAGFTAANASYGAARGIENTIRANRPIIDVQVNISATTIEKTVTVTDRNGPSGGSATDDYRNGMGAG
jgi:hypothetical protein